MNSIATYIDHTFLHPTAVYIDIKKICDEACCYHFAAACIPPTFVPAAREWLAGTGVKLATVIGFPFGYSDPTAKLAESREAIKGGADELDVVINLVALKNKMPCILRKEMEDIIILAHDNGRKVKVIIESGILTDEEIISCCDLYSGLGADFLKTSTGYAEKGASVHAVGLMKKNLPETVKIKASGGIRDFYFASQLVDAGASRLGCSASIAIVAGEARANVKQEE